jgi:FtsP/CotA-like multicopper oxidase with cupredoxin domain
MITRRNLLLSGAATVAGSALLSRTPALLAAAPATSAPQSPSTTDAQGDYLPVTIPNGARLPWKMVDGVKVFHLVAEEVDHEFAPGLRAACWGYNGSVHGPLIEAVDGDRVRIYVTNRLPAPTTVHWHSILLPNGMDGVGGLNQPAIPPGETFRYEFTLRQVGTAMYHAHHDEMTQIGLGMTGMFIIHPHPGKNYGDLRQPPVDRDFAIMLHEWRIDPGASRPNPLEMIEFNVLTMNAKVFPATEPLVVKPDSACASAWPTFRRWSTTPSISTATISPSPKPMADASPLPPSILMRRFWSRWARPAPSNSRPTPRATGPSIAT